MFIKILKCIIIILGTMIAAVGVTFFLNANIGVDPISTFILGIQNHISMKFGTINQIFSGIILVTLFFLDRKKIGIGSIIYALGCGYFINVFTESGIGESLGISTVGLTILGVGIFGMGIAIYLSTNLGFGPVEGIMLYCSNKLSLSIKIIRISIDATLVVLGLILGAKLGVGTLIGVLLTGPCIEISLRIINKVIKATNINACSD